LAAQEVTERLIRRGRTRIATIAGPQNMSAGIDRLQGWQLALNGAGLATDLVEYGDFSPASGAEAMRKLLARGVPFDGVFIASALMASGALAVTRDADIRVPEDLGVVTFDNNYAAQSSQPPLTTVEQPTIEVGREMADVLLRLIDGQRVHTVSMMPTTIIDRDSA
jgi:LacI family transcriptional regulator